MEPNNSVMQRSTALSKIAEAMAKQWFGYLMSPFERQYEWIVTGYASYAGWEMMRKVGSQTKMVASIFFCTRDEDFVVK